MGETQSVWELSRSVGGHWGSEERVKVSSESGSERSVSPSVEVHGAGAQAPALPEITASPSLTRKTQKVKPF